MAHTLKDRIRADRLAARQSAGEDVRRAETRALIAHLDSILNRDEAAACYAPRPTEPGYPDLVEAAVGICGAVLLPIARTSADGLPLPLQWAAHRGGALVGAPYGLVEPPPPWLPPPALATVRTVLVPAL
ncbi:MAG: 5-formyltetrahydrofolate cyclo-ligase, partial [Mycobacteriaceae bacterium]|nr:5-formyltetrahydrofolate cyclo-ligase [Mycobacteriaceae bacterium]